MLSVTKRIDTVSQPHGGYVPKKLFEIKSYSDFNKIQNVSAVLAPIQGMAVDYLTRFMISNDKYQSFDISIKGAILLDEATGNNTEYEHVLSLLDGVTGLNKQSIINVCKIVCYDSVLRAGLSSYQPAEEIEFSDELYANVSTLVNRSVSFLESIGPVISDRLTFEGGYTTLVSSGDGDYATKDTLIDIKVSKNEFSTKWSLQLLMYYILGIHSVHQEYKKIKKLCFFNAYTNQSYTCLIKNISDEVKYKVSQDVLGYKMATRCSRLSEDYAKQEDYKTWRKINGSDNEIAKQFLSKQFSKTGFETDNYGNGIFEITIDDYWTYLISNFDEYTYSLRPLFRNTKEVKLIKHNGFYMFVSVSEKGNYSLLHGARLHVLKYPLQYYYDNIERYATAILVHFNKYWDALNTISKQVQSLKPSDKYLEKEYSEYLKFTRIYNDYKTNKVLSFEDWCKNREETYRLSGNIHGCIIDIDWNNHIYLNPYDGSVIPYNAVSMYNKKVYKNTKSLLSVHHPEMLPSFNKMIKNNPDTTSLITQNSDINDSSLIAQDDSISLDFVRVYEHNMYDISNKLKPLQNIYDLKLVQVWYDEILNDKKEIINSTYNVKQNKRIVEQKYIGKAKVQKNTKVATIIRYENYHDIDVQFEDGIVVEHTSIIRWQNGNIIHPSIDIGKKRDFSKNKTKYRYIGISKMMNCGLLATIIDYKDCRNITIQFEDGLIKEGVRSDHFMKGKVKHNR